MCLTNGSIPGTRPGTSFHCIVLARLDPEWAKRQLILLLREWYLHPNGQVPAYEWNFSDLNPPVHAHAARCVYEISHELTGHADTDFLEEVFHKLLLTFTWWVNRQDPDGRNAFQGGFLGLDNIGVFDRSHPDLPAGSRLEQVDGTAWMGIFCLDMLAIAVELSHPALLRGDGDEVLRALHRHHPRDQRYLWSGRNVARGGRLLLRCDPRPDGVGEHLQIRSFVGLVPLFAALTIDADTLERLPRFRRRAASHLRYRPPSPGTSPC